MVQQIILTFLFTSLLGQLSAQAQSSTESAASALRQPTSAAPQSNGSQISTSIDRNENVKAKQKGYAIAFTIGKSQSLYKTGDGADSSSVDGALVGSMLVGNAVSLSAMVERSYDEKNQEAEWGRAQIGASLPKTAKSYFNFTPQLSFGFPVSKKDSSNSVRGRLAASLKIDLAPEKSGLTKFEISYTPSLNYVNTEYATSKFTGNPNVQNGFSQELSLAYKFNDKLAIKEIVFHTLQQTTTQLIKEGWSHNEELAYSVADHWAIALGHLFGAPYAPVRKDNQDLNLAFANDRDSVIYTQLTVDF